MLSLLRNIFILLIFMGLVNTLQAQYSQDKTEIDYSVKYENDSIVRILTFGKDINSSVYTYAKYSVSDFRKFSHEKNLSEEIVFIKNLWSNIKDSIELDIKSFQIAYPLFFTDILENQIKAFSESEEWKEHLLKNGKKLDYGLMHKVMIEKNVYQPLSKFLLTKNYSITGFSTEKHGFVAKDVLKKHGYSENEIIPMPYMLWLRIENQEK